MSGYRTQVKTLRTKLHAVAGGALFGTLISAMMVIACRPPSADTTARTPAWQVTEAATLTVLCADGSAKAGSGVLIGPDRMLTAAHVVTCDQGEPLLIQVELHGATTIAGVEVVSNGADIARLQTADALEFHAVLIGPRPEVGATICVAAGAPQGLTRRCGPVERFETAPGDIVHAVVTEPGNSGAGVYDDSGRLIGILSHYRTCVNGQLCGGKATSLDGRAWVTTW